MHACSSAVYFQPGKHATLGAWACLGAASGPALPACRYELLWAGEGSSLAGELRRRQLALRPGEPANIQFTSGGCKPKVRKPTVCTVWLRLCPQK